MTFQLTQTIGYYEYLSRCICWKQTYPFATFKYWVQKAFLLHLHPMLGIEPKSCVYQANATHQPKKKTIFKQLAIFLNSFIKFYIVLCKSSCQPQPDRCMSEGFLKAFTIQNGKHDLGNELNSIQRNWLKFVLLKCSQNKQVLKTL